MPADPGGAVGRSLRRAARLPDPDAPPDGRLLHRFRRAGDGDAFAELVRRHGPMVLGVCRRVAGNHADADDAFQAAFLVLVRRAAELTGRATVGDFLYGVAVRTALKARATAVTRRLKEARAAKPEAAPPPADDGDRAAALDRELARLPEKYRAALVLCELEGRPRKDVAALLGIPQGTLSSRLAAGRKLLADRLRRCGLAVPAGGLAVAPAASAVPPTLVETTIRSAAVTVGHAAGVVPAAANHLASEVARTMFLLKLRAGVLVLAAGLIGSAAGLAGLSHAVADPPAAKPAAGKADAGVTVKQLIEKERAATDALKGTWELVSRTTGSTTLKPGERKVLPGGDVTLFDVEYWRWTFGGRKLRIQYKRTGDERMGDRGETFDREVNVTVNPTTAPAQMTVYADNFLLLGIYRLDGDTLTFATHGISELERPRGFDPKDNRVTDLLLIVDVYHRLKPDGPKPKADPPADDRPAWRQEFDRVYALKDGEVLRRVAPPYPASRVDWWTDYFKGRASPDTEKRFAVFRYGDGRMEVGGAQMPVDPAVGVPLSDLLTMAAFPAQMVEGDDELLTAKVTGDFVLRAGADPAKVAAALGKVLRDAGVPAKLTVRDEEREVIVLKGKWASKPLDGNPKNHVELYSRALVEPPNGAGGGGTGTFSAFVGHLQRFINQRVVSEVAEAPRGEVSWRGNVRSPIVRDEATGQDTYAEDTAAGPVLVNVAAQTGLTFAVEKRKVPVLFVEKAK
jgi:RNA polymerase sigma factor (sigma-70 family)